MTSELNSIYQASFFGTFVGESTSAFSVGITYNLLPGVVYGGFLGSRKSYFEFMDRNQASSFESHLDAKRKLQDKVTIGFAKNAFRFGWRLGLFTTSYT